MRDTLSVLALALSGLATGFAVMALFRVHQYGVENRSRMMQARLDLNNLVHWMRENIADIKLTKKKIDRLIEVVSNGDIRRDVGRVSDVRKGFEGSDASGPVVDLRAVLREKKE